MTEAQARAAINNQHADLQRILEILQQRVEYGSVPGSYFPMYFQVEGAVTVGDSRRLSLKTTNQNSFRPIWCTGSLSGVGAATATFNLYYLDRAGAAQQLLTVDQVTNAGGTHVDRRADFTTDTITSGDFAGGELLQLTVIAITDVPEDLLVMLVCKNVGKVEPA